MDPAALTAAVSDDLGTLLEGAAVTAEVTALSAGLALTMALVMAFARLSPFRPLRVFGGVYVEVFRGTSLLVQLFFLFFVLPLLGIYLSPLVVAVVALGLNLGAYGAEIVRGSIQAVPGGQIEAALALNLSPWQRARRVVLPQALATMIPPLGNLAIELLKSTALVSLITLNDLTFRAQQIRNNTGETVEVFCLVLVLYFLMAGVITIGVRLLERRVTRYQRRGRIAGAAS